MVSMTVSGGTAAAKSTKDKTSSSSSSGSKSNSGSSSSGIYQVGADGKAPTGLTAGNQVVTGGGTYTINSVNADGTYNSSLTNKDLTTANYDPNGKNDTSGWVGGDLYRTKEEIEAYGKAKYGSGGSNYGSSSLKNYASSNQSASSTYNPVNQDDYMSNVLSYDDALAMAKQSLTPQYQQQYEQSAKQAAQNLGASGLYDSVYGQALYAEAQREIDRDLEAAIQSLALQLQGSSRDEALALLQLAIGENQFGANFDQNAMLEDRSYYERMLDRTIAQANSDRDYSLAQQAQDLKNRTQSYYETQSNWQMGGFDNQYQMEQALMELEYALKQKSSTSSSSSSGSVPVVPADDSSNSGTAKAGLTSTLQALINSKSASNGQESYTQQATGGYGAYDDSGAAQIGSVAAEAYQLYPQANSVRMAEGNVSAIDWISRNASSLSVAEELMKQLSIPNEAFNTWLGEQYSSGLITREQYLSAVKG